MASAWTNAKTWTAGMVVGETDFNTYVRDNTTFLKNPPFEQIVTSSGGALSTTASTAVPISTADVQITLATYGGNVNVHFQAPFDGGRIQLELLIDGTAFAGTPKGLVFRYTDENTGQMQYNVWVTGLASGSHTFTPAWFSTGQSISLSFSAVPLVFWAREG